MSEVTKKNSAQDLAIHEYLQSLLSEVPQTLDDDSTEVNVTPIVEAVAENKSQTELEKPLAEPEMKPVVVGLEQLVAEVPEVIAKTAVEVEVATKLETHVQVQEEVEQSTEIQTAIPDWAESRFQCLLFKVSGLSLAVPLVKLNSVIPWDENITETPNQTDWYLGLVQHLQNQIKVIDTALLVMPENRRASLDSDTENRLSHILLVDDYKWGLACSSIGDVIWLNNDEVKWRKNKTSRAWLSGTSLEHLCAIMDTEVFAQMLTESG